VKNNPVFTKALARHNAGHYAEAINLYKAVLMKNRMHLDANYLLGTAYFETGKLEEAKKYLLQAGKIRPDSPFIKVNLGCIYKKQGQYESAVTCLQRAVALKPDLAEGHINLGETLTALGRMEEAEACFRRALQINPDDPEVVSSLLFDMNYTARHHSELLAEACLFGQMAAAKAVKLFSAWQCALQPKRLRVGLVSGDLHQHPVGYFLENILARINPSRIELVAYSSDGIEDDLTARIKPFFTAWKSLAGLTDEAAARMIHADGIHVLLDLSGHTAQNRLMMFAWKPAPVQASWLGYFATTGLAEMDYLLADEVGVPPALQGQFTEKIWYLPDTRLCFTPPVTDLEVTQLPALQTGQFTFGCFQNLLKINDGVLSLWREILQRVPGSRLRLQYKQLEEKEIVELFIRRLQGVGIDPERVSLHGIVPREAYLAAHAEVDLLLDTFPYPGGATTCDGLWMGVPTLTLAGNTLISRQGASLLSAAGLSDLIADSEVEYVEKAVAIAHDPAKLAELRAGLRRQVQASPLFDAPRFAGHFEAALWGMWEQWQNRS